MFEKIKIPSHQIFEQRGKGEWTQSGSSTLTTSSQLENLTRVDLIILIVIIKVLYLPVFSFFIVVFLADNDLRSC